MKNKVQEIITEYLKLFPEEKERLQQLIKYIENSTDEEITDWNNFNGHLVAGGFIYNIKTKKFLLLHHKDLDMYLYPGGHIDFNDQNPLTAAKREVEEETNLHDLQILSHEDNKLIPLDIDTQLIRYNQRLNLPQHYHYDFRYLFIIDNNEIIKIDENELSDYQWLDFQQIKEDYHFQKISQKISTLLKNSNLL